MEYDNLKSLKRSEKPFNFACPHCNSLNIELIPLNERYVVKKVPFKEADSEKVIELSNRSQEVEERITTGSSEVLVTCNTCGIASRPNGNIDCNTAKKFFGGVRWKSKEKRFLREMTESARKDFEQSAEKDISEMKESE